MLQLGQRVALHLTHSLAAHAQLAADLLERRGLSLETEPQLEHSTLTLGQLLERIPDELPAQCVTGLLGRIHGALVGEQIAELAVTVGADRLVQRDRCLDRARASLTRRSCTWVGIRIVADWFETAR